MRRIKPAAGKLPYVRWCGVGMTPIAERGYQASDGVVPTCGSRGCVVNGPGEARER